MKRADQAITTSQILGGWTPSRAAAEHSVLITGRIETAGLEGLVAGRRIVGELCAHFGRGPQEPPAAWLAAVGGALPYIVASGLSYREATRLEDRLNKAGALTLVCASDPRQSELVRVVLDHPLGPRSDRERWAQEVQLAQVVRRVRRFFGRDTGLKATYSKLCRIPYAVERPLQRIQAEALAAQLRELGWSVELRDA